MELDSLRKKIDSVDSKILSLLNERASISLNVGLAKKALENTKPDQDSAAKSKDEVYVPTREKAIFEKLIKMNHGPLANESIIAIYREVMSASISLQKEVTIAFLGPAGTHTHQAATARFGDSVLYVPQDTIADIFTAVEQGRATYGVVPFENSTFGSVSQTLDRFISSNVQIRGETYLGVHHCLMSNSSMQQIRRIYSHPEAFGQCQRWLDANLGNVERINVSSTAFAAELASKELHSAAICSYACAELYGLDIIQQKIEDMRTGALCDALRTFKDFGINLTKIDSRPSGQRMWHYVFFVEMEGHMKNETVVKAMEELQKVCVDLRVLGSYPNQRSFVVA
ncbi:Prephenate dehydratase-domain-containing protein [Paraphysoderma sedebokerense]|nr:Prephenate dehydratase-domain-containing protein [Paraphysoderma sedebokerense]